MHIWQRNRHRADNISAIVVFLDDEFLPEEDADNEDDEDTVSIASSEADTVIMSGQENDTPPMSGSEHLSSLVRQIGLPFNNQSERSRKLSASKSSNETSAQGLEGKTSQSHHKRKLDCGDDNQSSSAYSSASTSSTSSSGSSKSKKAKHSNTESTPSNGLVESTTSPSSPPLNASEDSHQCNSVITVLSAESLCDLQLDAEDLGFVESTTSGLSSSSSRVDSPTRSLNHHHHSHQRLTFEPVPQVAK